MERRKIDQIVDPAIGTAESIIDLAKRWPDRVSDVLRGTAGKYLTDTMGRVAGYKGAPMRKMQNLLNKLCPRAPYEIPYYPHAELPPKNIVEEIQDFAQTVVDHLPYMRTDEANNVSKRMLNLIDKTYTLIPFNIRKLKDTFIKFVPEYIDPDPTPTLEDLHYPWLHHRAEISNLEQIHTQALALFNMPPKGNA